MAVPIIPATSASTIARRQLGGVVIAAASVLVVSAALDRTELRRVGPWSSVSSWTTPSQTLVGLRLLRMLAFVGSAGILVWLVALALLCVPSRTRGIVGKIYVPGAALVRGALVGSIAIAALGVSGSSAMAERRSITATHDATGGQRWPKLTTPSVAPATVALPATTVASTAEPATALSAIAVVTTAVALPEVVPPPSIPVNTSVRSVVVTPTGTAGPTLPMDVAFWAETVSRAPDRPVVVHLVVAGESFWSIAEEHVLQNMDEASDADVASYWRVLVEANRSRLPDPNNPDLLWVGTQLDLPPLPATAPPLPGGLS